MRVVGDATLHASSPVTGTSTAVALAAFLLLFGSTAASSSFFTTAATESSLSLQSSSRINNDVVVSNSSSSDFQIFVGAYCNGSSTALSTGEGCWKGAPSWTGELDMVELNKCLGGVLYSCSVDAGVVLRVYATHDTTCSGAVQSKVTVVPPQTFNRTTFDAKTNTSMHFTCETSLYAVVGTEPWVAFAEYYGVDNCSAAGAGHYTLRQVDRCLSSGTLASQTLSCKLTWLPSSPPVLTTTYVKVKTFGSESFASLSSSSPPSTFGSSAEEGEMSELADTHHTAASAGVSCSGSPSVEYFEQGRCAELSGGLSSLVTCDSSGGYSRVQFSQPNCKGNARVISSVAAEDLNLCAASHGGQAASIVVTCNVTAFDANDATGLEGYVEHGYSPTSSDAEGGAESPCSGAPVYLAIGALSECRNASTPSLVLSEQKIPINHPFGPDPYPGPPNDDTDLASWKIAVIAVVSSVVVALGLATFFLVRRPLRKRKVSSTSSSAVSSPTRRALVLDAEEHASYDAI